MATYYLGVKFGADMNPENVVAGTSTAGAAVDYEMRLETGNGGTRKGAIEALTVIEAFINGNGQAGAGANLPPL
jgi:hypothetical protein